MRLIKWIGALAFIAMCSVIAYGIASAQTTSERFTCTDGAQVYRDGQIIYGCRIQLVNGTPTAFETLDGKSESQRSLTAREMAQYQITVADRQCRAGKESATSVITTRPPAPDVNSLATRVAALETLILSEC